MRPWLGVVPQVKLIYEGLAAFRTLTTSPEVLYWPLEQCAPALQGWQELLTFRAIMLHTLSM